MYVYTHVCIYTCMYIHMYVYIHVCIYTCMYIYMCVYVHVCVHTYIHTCIVKVSIWHVYTFTTSLVTAERTFEKKKFDNVRWCRQRRRGDVSKVLCI